MTASPMTISMGETAGADVAGVKLRFAPSPTGLLHVGNAQMALANALFARAHGGVFQLRFDDTDAVRTRADEFEPAIKADLRWLGLDWQESFRQSDRLDRYALAAEHLRDIGRLYPCFESEEELHAKREARIRARKPPIYDRGALRMTAAQRATAEANGKRPYWRFLLSDAKVFWQDLGAGRREVKLSAVSDPVLIRADGTTLYTLASVVDDRETGITHVVRGEDHVTNTGVQIDIAAALGDPRDRMRFGHLPLMLDEAGGKLSKRTGAASLRALRHDGVEPRALTSYLARLGTADDPELLDFDALARTQNLAHASRSQPRFDTHQLLGLNRHLLASLPFDAVASRLPDGATEAFWLAVRGNLDLLTEARAWGDVVFGDIVPPPIEGEAEFLRAARDVLPPEPWSETTWEVWTEALRERTGRRGRALFMPLRLALTGEDHGPELRVLIGLMGRARILARLALAGS